MAFVHDVYGPSRDAKKYRIAGVAYYDEVFNEVRIIRQVEQFDGEWVPCNTSLQHTLELQGEAAVRSRIRQLGGQWVERLPT